MIYGHVLLRPYANSMGKKPTGSRFFLLFLRNNVKRYRFFFFFLAITFSGDPSGFFECRPWTGDTAIRYGSAARFLKTETSNDLHRIPARVTNVKRRKDNGNFYQRVRVRIHNIYIYPCV